MHQIEGLIPRIVIDLHKIEGFLHQIEDPMDKVIVALLHRREDPMHRIIIDLMHRIENLMHPVLLQPEKSSEEEGRQVTRGLISM